MNTTNQTPPTKEYSSSPIETIENGANCIFYLVVIFALLFGGLIALSFLLEVIKTLFL
jgi:hypothetical protein